MENDTECPAAHFAISLLKGRLKDFDDVYNFGKHLDALTIEIESVNEKRWKIEEEVPELS